WREEQPLQHALVGQDWGDMPHNWASAECVRYLRHMFLLEDGPRMRLLEGMIPASSRSENRFASNKRQRDLGASPWKSSRLQNRAGEYRQSWSLRKRPGV